MTYSKEELARYRISRAWEALDESRVLAETGHWNTATNRLYYACFYIVSAYLILKGIVLELKRHLPFSRLIQTKTGSAREGLGVGWRRRA
jgi:uncharacterized protein (UPF0332 family)